MGFLKKFRKKAKKFIKKNGRKVAGAWAAVGGAILVATGVGAGIGAPLMAVGVKAATTKDKIKLQDEVLNGLAANVGTGGKIDELAHKFGGVGASVLHQVSGGLENGFGDVLKVVGQGNASFNVRDIFDGIKQGKDTITSYSKSFKLNRINSGMQAAISQIR